MPFHLLGKSGTKGPLFSSLPYLGTLSRTRTKYQRSEESHTLCMHSLSLHWTFLLLWKIPRGLPSLFHLRQKIQQGLLPWKIPRGLPSLSYLRQKIQPGLLPRKIPHGLPSLLSPLSPFNHGPATRRESRRRIRSRRRRRRTTTQLGWLNPGANQALSGLPGFSNEDHRFAPTITTHYTTPHQAFLFSPP